MNGMDRELTIEVEHREKAVDRLMHELDEEERLEGAGAQWTSAWRRSGRMIIDWFQIH